MHHVLRSLVVEKDSKMCSQEQLQDNSQFRLRKIMVGNWHEKDLKNKLKKKNLQAFTLFYGNCCIKLLGD